MRISMLKGVVAAGALTLACSATGAWYHWHAVQNANGRLQQLNQELRQVNAENDRARAVIAKNPDLVSERQTLLRRIPERSRVGAFLEALSQKLADLGIAGQEVVTEPTVTGKLYSRERVVLRFRADSPQVYEVLEFLRNQERLIRVDKMRIERAQDDGSPQIEIEFFAFAVPPEEAAAWAGTN